jgi:SAM-dependent methyltransferase
VLCQHLAKVIPAGARLLDIGTGDGLLASLIASRRPDVEVKAIETIVRQGASIPVAQYDGTTIPYADGEFDAAMFVDVLHHTNDPMVLLREAKRVARNSVIIKDHTLEGFVAGPTLRFMDRMGNEKHGVPLPCNYWTRAQWTESFETLGMTVAEWKANLGLYPWPASLIFERSLHFVARLDTAS